MNILVTGAAGFIGSSFVRLALRELPGANFVIFDALTYAGNLSTIEDVLRDARVSFHEGWIQDADKVREIVQGEQITHIVNFAAETHNDRSLLESGSFIQTDVFGVYVLLEVTRQFKLEKMVHVSTDEVYGSTLHGEFTENSPLEPNTPYSASKAGGDLQIRAHFKSFGTPALVTRGGNTYGPYQFPEKLIPFFVTRLKEGKKVPLYGEGNQVREWIHVMDHASGVLKALLEGNPGEIYNVGDENEHPNREVVKILLEETGRDPGYVKKIPDPRGGAHDQRYSMSSQKLRSMGWRPVHPFEEGLRETVRWYLANESWWRPLVQEPEFQAFIKQFYGPGLGEDL